MSVWVFCDVREMRDTVVFRGISDNLYSEALKAIMGRNLVGGFETGPLVRFRGD